MPEIKINIDFVPDRIEVYQLINVWECRKCMGIPQNIVKVDTQGNILGKERKDAIGKR